VRTARSAEPARGSASSMPEAMPAAVPVTSDDILSVASWSCRDGRANAATSAAATSVCTAYQQLLELLPTAVSAYPNFKDASTKEKLVAKIQSERRLARMKPKPQTAASSDSDGTGDDLLHSTSGLLYTLLGMVVAASPIVICYLSPAARAVGLRCLSACNSYCVRIQVGAMDGKLYHLFSRKNAARKEAERVVRSLTANEGTAQDAQDVKDSA